MTAEAIARALGGRKAGGGWTARCPAHDGRTPSLSIRDGDDNMVLVRCHAGCDQVRVIAALRGRGLWVENGPRTLSRMARRTPIEHKPDHDDTKCTQAALAIWQSAKPAQGTPVETYLASRAICLPTPDALSFHAGLKHPSGGIWPVMVALVTKGEEGTPLAIHRTFLACNGVGKAPVDPQKMMFGPCRRGAVRIADAIDVLMVGEGIETCLAANWRAAGGQQGNGLQRWEDMMGEPKCTCTDPIPSRATAAPTGSPIKQPLRSAQDYPDSSQTRRSAIKGLKAFVANQPKRTRGNPKGEPVDRPFQVALDDLHHGPFGWAISSAIGKRKSAQK